MKHRLDAPKIEKNIPMRSERGLWVSLLKSMKVGDSFKIEKLHVPAIHNAAKRNGIDVVMRSLDNKKQKGICRIWRIK